MSAGNLRRRGACLTMVLGTAMLFAPVARVARAGDQVIRASTQLKSRVRVFVTGRQRAFNDRRVRWDA